jgi:hypothetical protein
MGSKIISYTLYGNNHRYTSPLIKNALLFDQYYPGWEMHVYYDNSVDTTYLNRLKKTGITLINAQDFCIPPKLWRYLPISKGNIDCVIFRDADSLLSKRESRLVSEWIESNYLFHIIRDHPMHISPILAGMFGVKKSGFSLIYEIIKDRDLYQMERVYDYDQVLLADYIYPKIHYRSMIHTSFFKFHNEKVRVIKPVFDYIGLISESSDRDKDKDRELIVASSFISGVPYHLAKIVRYRIRLVKYMSIFYNLIAKKQEAL